MNCKLCGHPASDHIQGAKSIVGVVMCVEDKCNCHLTQSDVEAQTNNACSRQEPAGASESQVACGSCG